MPRGSNMPKEDQLVKLLLVAPSKMGKTHYVMEAAKAGFNLLYLDGDVSRPTIQSFDEKTLNRVWYMNLEDTQKLARLWQIVEKLFTETDYLWDDTNQRTLNTADIEIVAVWLMNMVQMTCTDVLGLDSWTAIVESIKHRVAKKIGTALKD